MYEWESSYNTLPFYLFTTYIMKPIHIRIDTRPKIEPIPEKGIDWWGWGWWFDAIKKYIQEEIMKIFTQLK